MAAIGCPGPHCACVGAATVAVHDRSLAVAFAELDYRGISVVKQLIGLRDYPGIQVIFVGNSMCFADLAEGG